MSDDTTLAEEMFAAINRFIDDRYPEAAKYLLFVPVYDKEPYLVAQFPGLPKTHTRLDCLLFGTWTKETYIAETLSRIESLIPSIVGTIVRRINALRVCEKCVKDMARCRRFLATVQICNEECSNDAESEFNLAVANIIEQSLERQEQVADAMRLLPLPISQEIMWHFVA